MDRKYEAIVEALREMIEEAGKAVETVNAQGIGFREIRKMLAGLALASERGKDALAQLG